MRLPPRPFAVHPRVIFQTFVGSAFVLLVLGVLLYFAIPWQLGIAKELREQKVTWQTGRRGTAAQVWGDG